ncbi:hypothetical protein GJ744_010301 [Endocarpon pusillum]|uniref:Uncharacterized protein n=1 Tax=Endocarpon pusillum TaxID=364733 RepID=A0A8H7AIA8_9EURO|nr:hypothetical protein GJ744_010301 [Endocarpon pusillum]
MHITQQEAIHTYRCNLEYEDEDVESRGKDKTTLHPSSQLLYHDRSLRFTSSHEKTISRSDAMRCDAMRCDAMTNALLWPISQSLIYRR